MEQRKKKLVVGITIPASVGLLRGQMKYFSEHGYETCLLTQHDERSIEYCQQESCRPLNIAITREISLIEDFKTLVALIKLFKKEKPDIINAGTPKMGLLGMMAAWWCRVPKRIYTCRGFRYESERGKTRTILKATERVAGFCAKQIICISPSLKDVAIKDRIFNKKKCVVINKGSSNGIELSNFDINSVNKEEQLVLRQRLGIQNDFVFGFLGRIRDDKGINELFKSFESVYQTNNQCKLLVVGPWDGEHIKDKELYSRMTNHPGVIVPGRTDDVAMFLSLMDVFVMTTWREGFGNVYIQAAAMGIPVIGSDVTGSKSAVCANFNGMLVNPHDVSDITAAMLTLMNDSELRKKYGINGIEWAQNFKSETIWEGMDKLYKA